MDKNTISEYSDINHHHDDVTYLNHGNYVTYLNHGNYVTGSNVYSSKYTFP